jgi:hypothetical protein
MIVRRLAGSVSCFTYLLQAGNPATAIFNLLNVFCISVSWSTCHEQLNVDLTQNLFPKGETFMGKKMTVDRAAKIQSETAKQNGGQVSKDSFAARATRAAAKNKTEK